MATPRRGGTFRTLVMSSRPLSWVNTAFPFAAGYLMTTHRVDLTFIIGTLFFLIPYNVAMYGINDVFDYESDMRNPRKGGVEGAVLDRRLHRLTLWVALATNLPFLVFLVIVGSPLSWLVLAVSMFAVVAYSLKGLRFKEIPFLDSITSSTHFVSPAIYGLVLAGAVFTPALWLILAAYFLWGVASHAFGAIQDIQADREGGLASVATVMGARFTARFALGAYFLAGVALVVAGMGSDSSTTLFAAALAIPYLIMVWPFRSLPDADCERANRGWRAFLWINYAAGFAVTLLLILNWTRVGA
jgi:4-hydroxybenzoate polyprenyltransferase